MSPVGTAELSPGRSPGLACALKSPVGTTERAIGSGLLNRGISNFQSSLRDSSPVEFLPRTLVP
jgi:hypothetical protein